MVRIARSGEYELMTPPVLMCDRNVSCARLEFPILFLVPENI